LREEVGECLERLPEVDALQALRDPARQLLGHALLTPFSLLISSQAYTFFHFSSPLFPFFFEEEKDKLFMPIRFVRATDRKKSQ